MKTYRYLNCAQIVVNGDDDEIAALDRDLTFKDLKAVQQHLQFKKSGRYFIPKHGHDVYQRRLDELAEKIFVKLVENQEGEFVTYAGFATRLERDGWKLEGQCPLNAIEADLGNWDVNADGHALRYYQKEAVTALLGARHAAISLPTGAGKSSCIEDLIRQHRVKTLVIAPSKSIFKQLFTQFTKTFGSSLVGRFGDGKKESKKQIVVGIDKSVTKVEQGCNFYDDLVSSRLLIIDESHLASTEIIKKICLGLGATAQFRYFVSATQFRNDGADLLLEGLIGPTVYEKTLTALVDEGFLARPKYLAVKVTSPTSFVGEYDDMIQTHVYDNPELARAAATLGNRFAAAGKSVLILIDRMAQFRRMLPFLAGDFGFAHGTMSKEEKSEIPERWWKDDVENLVERFNNKDLKLLVGTTCITTGTDLRPTDVILYLMTGKSEIRVCQARGRATRLVPGKTDFTFVDFDIEIPGVAPYKNVLHQHFKQRLGFYGIQKIPTISL